MQYLKPEIRAKILSSALDEFAEHGYARAQMRRIARGAGISTSNIYRYFAGMKLFLPKLYVGYMNRSRFNCQCP